MSKTDNFAWNWLLKLAQRKAKTTELKGQWQAAMIYNCVAWFAANSNEEAAKFLAEGARCHRMLKTQEAQICNR